MMADVEEIRAFESETYLGDGLYVKFDGFSFVLRAPREDGDHFAYLDPPVLNAFLKYVQRVHGKIAEINEATKEVP